jgi:2-dehydro-3-deoxyphosphogluconate aldolase/(4S)-4-hydroxy-2-oxoglutarate aldolase
MTDAVLTAIERTRLLPVLRCASGGDAVAQARRLVDAGLAVVELTATTPDWPDALTTVRTELPGVTVGLGTVVTVEDAELAVSLGADFLVSPYPVLHVAAAASAAGVPLLQGAFSPSELAAVTARGVAKLFPAHVGGVGYLRSVLAVLPGARIVPTGGIRLGDVGAWLAAGAFAVGVGSDLTAEGDIEARVRKALAGIGETR